MIREAVKPHALLSASWRSGKARGGVVQGLKSRDPLMETLVCRSENQEHREQISVPVQEVRQRTNSSFLHLSVPFRPSVDSRTPTDVGGGHVLYSVHQFKC